MTYGNASMFIRTAMHIFNRKFRRSSNLLLTGTFFCRENKPKHYFYGVNAAILLFMLCRNPYKIQYVQLVRFFVRTVKITDFRSFINATLTLLCEIFLENVSIRGCDWKSITCTNWFGFIVKFVSHYYKNNLKSKLKLTPPNTSILQKILKYSQKCKCCNLKKQTELFFLL